MKKIITFTLVALLLAACLPKDMQVPQSPLLSVLERKSGLIAYIGVDWNIYVTDQSGGNKITLTEDAAIPEAQTEPFRYYPYLSWSPESNLLAFVGVSGEGGNQGASDLYVANVDEERVDKVHTSDTEHPFYLYWSPDNENLSFLSTAASGQSFILQSIPAQGGDLTILDTGSPYYWSWAPDGNTMIVHTGAENSPTVQHMAFLQVGSQIIEAALDPRPAAFQAPAWSPDGSHILLSRLNDKKEKEIILTDGRGSVQKALGTFEASTSFAWSHDSELVAYIAGDRALTAGTIGTMHVMDLTASEDFFQDEDVIAFFWSPDSRKLAYFKPFLANSSSEGGTDTSGQAQQNLALQLNVLDVISGESRELFAFRPTDQFAAILPYFDQYHQSTTIWSPDSNNLVLSFLTSENKPGIAIVAASGQLEPRVLAEGYLAFWSWK
jgi:Tol biopolymer transport system component